MLVFPMITIGIPNAGQDADSGLLQWGFFGVGEWVGALSSEFKSHFTKL